MSTPEDVRLLQNMFRLLVHLDILGRNARGPGERLHIPGSLFRRLRVEITPRAKDLNTLQVVICEADEARPGEHVLTPYVGDSLMNISRDLPCSSRVSALGMNGFT
eukprot:CAMPEP_0198573724 /NCGR_PEP_ID=MMETSP1462-20131121/113622_1 /TAXON_ID=1333877 /ORGANISM="Brandtodinium nutriculum, Strain RCC3387" /LENGTH=105 /DNA_ID=CAMNT_0044304917 /DNA_START=150 /DNA_END=464 /DNA_ORIENTATION=+